MENKRVLNFNEACELTSFAPSYLYKLTSAGVVPFSKPNGKRIFFDREKLEHWLLSNATMGSDERDKAAATYVSTHK